MPKKRRSAMRRMLLIPLIGSLGVLFLFVILTLFFEGSIYRSRYLAVQESLARMARQMSANYELLRSSGISEQESCRQSMELAAAGSEYGSFLSLIDREGRPVLTGADTSPEGVCTAAKALKPDTPGYAILTWQDSMMYAGCAPLQYDGMALLLFCPPQLLVQDYISIRNNMVGISMLVFAATFLAAFLWSLQPVRGLEEDNRSLAASGWSIGRKYARQYLYGLAVGRHTQIGELEGMAAEYLPFSLGRPFGLLLVQVDQQRRFAALPHQESALILFGVCNVLEELCQDAAILQGYPEEGTKQFAALYQPRPQPAALADRLRDVQQKVLDIYGYSVTILYRPAQSSLYQLPDEYALLLLHTHDRLLHGAGSLLLIKEGAASDAADSSWQKPYRQQLVLLLRCLQDGTLQERGVFSALLRTQAQDWWRYRSALLLMSGGIEQCVLVLISARKLNADFSFHLNTEDFDSAAEIEDFIDRSIDEINASVRSAADRRTHLYTQMADELIEQHYRDSSYGVQQIAGEIGITSVYLSKLYKQQTGSSILDRLTFCRLQHALALLEKDDIPVGDVFRQCGYSSVNYFYHIFKKATGVTPKQYRTMLPEQRKRLLEGKEGSEA